jgi:3-oxoacyl-[acyl-carrier protein] reductase
MPETPADVLSLAGRVAVVTGAGRGIGAATACLLARAGAQLALVDCDAAGVTQTAERIALDGGEALAFTNDVTDAFAVERTLDRVAEEWGRLDVLVNNAGTLREALLEELTDEDFQETLDVNLRAAMVCARAAVPHMLRQGRGRILSAASATTRLGFQGLTAYAAAKAGIVGMTRTWARELGPRGITANAVAPGLIEGDTPHAAPSPELQAALARLPARRLGKPEEVAAVYLFLASDLASFINGAVVGVDGGLLLY